MAAEHELGTLNSRFTDGQSQVRKFVIRREVQPKKEGGKPYTKAPKIQRLITPQRIQHKRRRLALKRRQSERVKDAAVSNKLISYYRSIDTDIYPIERVRSDSLQARPRRERQAHRAPQAKSKLNEEVGAANGDSRSCDRTTGLAGERISVVLKLGWPARGFFYYQVKPCLFHLRARCAYDTERQKTHFTNRELRVA